MALHYWRISPQTCSVGQSPVPCVLSLESGNIIDDNVLNIHIKIRIPMVLVRLAVFVVLLYRRARYGYPFRRVPLTQGKYAIVDLQDYAWLRKYKWHVIGRRGKFYAFRKGLAREGRKNQCVWMHREILPVKEGFVVDHINRNKLDNRRANLRQATRTQNSYNSRKRKNTRSRYKGVHMNDNKWRAVINVDGRRISLGYFVSQAEAARAYDKAARKHQKAFAYLNFPD